MYELRGSNIFRGWGEVLVVLFPRVKLDLQ